MSHSRLRDLEGEEEMDSAGTLLKEVIAEKFPNLTKYINLQIQESKWTWMPNIISLKKSIPTFDSIVKFIETKDKTKILKGQEKNETSPTGENQLQW